MGNVFFSPIFGYTNDYKLFVKGVTDAKRINK
jgi:hypothetical protein